MIGIDNKPDTSGIKPTKGQVKPTNDPTSTPYQNKDLCP
jgi:hypothetical protein